MQTFRIRLPCLHQNQKHNGGIKMKKLCAKLSISNIKSGKQFYIPYLLMGIISVIMFYSMVAFKFNEGMDNMPGGTNLTLILNFGIYVIGIFVAIFLFYTNSFIVRRRKKELGMYNILGMEKKHIARLLLVETFIVAAICIGGGLILGIIFNKFLTMILFKLIGVTTTLEFYVSGEGILYTCILFGGIFVFILLYNIMQVKLSKPVELLSSGNVGEREPKTKILMTIAGLLCLGAGYYIALTTENPIAAMALFFVAVVLVIVGTYLLFTSGSIALLKMLRKNKKYYYKTRHFTAVSGMIYRMKQNAVGLANICILSTMVLVMMSSTISMFVGVEDELIARFPNEISVNADSEERVDSTKLLDIIKTEIEESNREITYETSYEGFDLVTVRDNNEFITNEEGLSNYTNYNDFYAFFVMTKESYEQMSGENICELKSGEVALIGTPDYKEDVFRVLEESFDVAYHKDYVSREDEYMSNIVKGMYVVVVADDNIYENLYQKQKEALGEKASQNNFYMSFDIDGSKEEKIECDERVNQKIAEITGTPDFLEYSRISLETRETERIGFRGMYGGLFFLGLFLGIMFLMVTVLIIFYKQISEGYEDRERFSIMEKVGMSNQEVKQSISAQVRMVFLLPIVTATIHVAFAFPMIKKLLALMNLTNATLFLWCLIGSIVGFFTIYVVVFLLTSRSYYKIVGRQV